ncbi:MAG TPA: glycosyltransferase [Candidatus Bathyarchaeia archaeon]|nr:glycosyltransferase [Candidatus Bathyarchaeia archaeon]
MDEIRVENMKSNAWGWLPQLSLRKSLFQLGLIALGFVLLFFLTLMKANGTNTFRIDPWLYLYTIFVTTFQLSRLFAAMFYEHSYRGSVLDKSAGGIEQLAKRKYEPFITFVVPCKNEEKVIAETLENCFNVEYPREKIEVIAINDGSTDGTAAAINSIREKHENLFFINWETNRGKKFAMAKGFHLAKGEIVIQLDSDSFLDPATFRKIVEPFQNPKIGAVSVHTDPKNADKNFLTRMQAAYYFMSFRILKAAEASFLTVFCCSGCASAYRKSVVLPHLEEWLSETFLGLPVTWGDDRALTSRVIKAGYKTIYSDKVKAETIVPEKFRQLIKQQIRWKKSWFVNAIYNSRFIWKEQPFVAFSYYFPLIAVSFLSPFMAVRAIVYLPLAHHVFPLYHAAGLLLLMALFVAYYRFVAPENKYWKYLFPWAIFNFFMLSFLMFYALAKINDRGWGTR